MDTELILFRDYLCENSGIFISEDKAYLFETRLSKMMADAGTESFGEFYKYVLSGTDPLIKQKIVDAMTTNETKWFRDLSPWKVMEERLLPKLVDGLLTGRIKRARIWFAAVSTGQEAYSTVMCVDNYLKANNVKGVTLSDFEFLATDISGRVLDLARRGRYDAISIARGLGDHYKNAYFVQDNAAWNLKPEIRDAVKFEKFNLLNSYAGFGLFNIIFCRYVLIYFTNELKKEIMSKMYYALADGGVMFTGNYALYDLFSSDFGIAHYENLTYYTKKAMANEITYS